MQRQLLRSPISSMWCLPLRTLLGLKLLLPRQLISPWDWTGGVTPKTASGLELGAAATYALSDDAKVGVSYTSRTQTFKDLIPEELKDSFVKVYFSTSF
jgi:hypothetical protein